MKRLLVLVTLVLGVAQGAAAQPVVFVVRHAERADAAAGAAPMMAADPDLSAAGRERAAALAAMLKDANLTAIYATEYKRTQQTAGAVAKTAGLTVTTVPAKDIASVVEKATSSSGNVLVVGHSNTVPDIIKGLGVEIAVTIGDSEYDNLFVVIRGAKPVLVRLHFFH